MDPSKFDIGNKNFLTYQEYVSYAVSSFKEPLQEKEIGSKIKYDEIEFKKQKYDLKIIFDLLSDNSKFIDFSTLMVNVKRMDLPFSESDVKELLDFFKKDKISYSDFINMFS